MFLFVRIYYLCTNIIVRNKFGKTSNSTKNKHYETVFIPESYNAPNDSAVGNDVVISYQFKEH